MRTIMAAHRNQIVLLSLHQTALRRAAVVRGTVLSPPESVALKEKRVSGSATASDQLYLELRRLFPCASL